MTLAELIQQVEIYPRATETASITAWLNWAYREAAKLWALRKADVPITLVRGAYSYSLPADCWLVESVYYAGEPLTYATEEWLDRNCPSWRTTQGVPYWWFVERRERDTILHGRLFIAYPPDATASTKPLTITHSLIPPSLAAPTDVPWLPPHLHDAFWHGAIYKIAETIEDWDWADRYKALWEAGLVQIAEDARLKHGRKESRVVPPRG